MTDIREHGILFSGPLIGPIFRGEKTETRRLITARRSLYDGGPVPGARWKELDWDDVVVDPGPSPTGNPGPYLKVARPFEISPTIDPRQSHHGRIRVDTRHRIYPRIQPGDRLWVRETWAPVGDHPDPGVGVTTFFKADFEDFDSIYDQVRWQPSIFLRKKDARLWLRVEKVWPERLHDIDDDGALAEGVDRTNTSIPGYATERFRRLWIGIHGDESWESNPWVWVYRFKLES